MREMHEKCMMSAGETGSECRSHVGDTREEGMTPSWLQAGVRKWSQASVSLSHSYMNMFLWLECEWTCV